MKIAHKNSYQKNSTELLKRNFIYFDKKPVF